MSRPFADVLRDLTGGQTYEELTSALAEVVAAVLDTKKVGTLTLNLKIRPNGDAGVMITDDIKSTVPVLSRGETFFFATSGGSLVRDDPRQEKLPLRQVPAAVPQPVAAE